MENTLTNKARFFAQYWWQKLFVINGNNEDTYNNWRTEDLDKGYMLLTPLSDITDEDAIKCAQLAHDRKSDFKVDRRNDIIHVTYFNESIKAEYHVCINFRYATINCNLHFKKDGNDEAESFKVNIGEVQMSAYRVVGYIQIVDFLRSKSYAIPYMGLSVEKLIEYGWVKLKTSNQ